MIFTSIEQPKKIGKTDLEIIKILTKNARESIVSIANKLNISAKTASARIKRAY